MKNGDRVEKIIFLCLLLVSSGVAYIVLTKSRLLSSDNTLLFIISVFWMILEQRKVKKLALTAYQFSKKLFRFTGKKHLHQA